MSADTDRLEPGPVENFSLWVSAGSMIAMTAIITVEVVLRATTGGTLEWSDEIVGYLLVALSFVSLSLCQSEQSFHKVEIVQARLGPRGRAASTVLFEVLSLGYMAITEYWFVRFVMSSYRQESMANTALATPLWIPESVMVLGGALMIWTQLRIIARDARRLFA